MNRKNYVPQKVSTQTNLFLGMKEWAQERGVVHVLVVENVSARILLSLDSNDFV